MLTLLGLETKTGNLISHVSVIISAFKLYTNNIAVNGGVVCGSMWVNITH